MVKNKKTKEGMVVHPGIGEKITDVIIWIILIGCMAIAIIPMWHTLMASLSDGNLMLAHNGVLWKWATANGGPNWGGYIKTLAYENMAIIKSYGYTILYVIGNVLLGLGINAIAAYCIYRKPKASGLMMLIIIISMMFNGGTVPTYMVIKKLGMTGTIWSLLIPDCTNAMFVILTLNAYKQVPVETVESAELDGAGHFTIMFRILLPQAMGLITVTMINTAIITWNSWFSAMLYVPSNKEVWPIQLWIKQIVADASNITTATAVDWNRYLVSFCVIIVATLPVLIAMPFAQKQLQKGSLTGAVKG